MVRLAALAIATLAAACSSTAVPTGPPPSPTTPAPTTTAMQPETAAPSAIPSVAHKAPPTGSTEVVLRMSRIFTLYADGRVIYTAKRPLSGGAMRHELRQAQLTPEQSAALVGNALDVGGLGSARESYADVPIADATTTVFEVTTAEVRKRVSVYALGEFEVDEAIPDAEIPESFANLAEALANFDTEAEAGSAVELGLFEPTAYRVSIFPDVGNELTPDAEWPWDDLQPENFDIDNSGFGHLVVPAAQAEVVVELPVGDIGDPVVAGPDDVLYLVRARPLLPDEVP